MTGLDLTLILQILYWFIQQIEAKMIEEAVREKSGKLEQLQASLSDFKKAKTPKERKDAALALQAARKK